MCPINKIRHAILLLFLVPCVGYSADTFPFIVVDEFKFGNIVPRPGKCVMAHDTGLFTNDISHICPSRIGRPGFYYIVVPKNSLMRVTLRTFTHPDHYYTFTPAGEINNRHGTKKQMVAETTTIIDSGDDGVLEMRVAGTLDVLSPLSPSTDYSKLLTVDIELTP